MFASSVAKEGDFKVGDRGDVKDTTNADLFIPSSP